MKAQLKSVTAATLATLAIISGAQADDAATRPATSAAPQAAVTPAATSRGARPRVATTAPAVRQAAQDPASDPAKAPVPTPAAEVGDLRELIGVNPGIKLVEMPHMPVMSLRGFVQGRGQQPMALLEIKDMDRSFLVQAGTEIPIMVTGRVTPIGHDELGGLQNDGKAPAAPVTATDVQSQIILKVVKVSGEGVIIKTGLMAQTIVVR